jgi:glucose-1-phosphate thymidylyltransferase
MIKMKCILLAAGYATRLYPLTKDKPKSLLKIADKTILQHILEKIEVVDEIDDIYIVTNEPFYKSFTHWVNTYPSVKKITTINDHTTNNENRLGAIADLQLVIEKEQIEDDILVMAGDNLFDFDLRDFISFYKKANSSCITTHEIKEVEELKRTGVIELREDNSVKSFEEKPKEPKSNLAVPPFYIYKKQNLPLIKQYLSEGNNPDAPGNFIPWLIQKETVYAYKFTGYRYDIGTLESYKMVDKIFSNK